MHHLHDDDWAAGSLDARYLWVPAKVPCQPFEVPAKVLCKPTI